MSFPRRTSGLESTCSSPADGYAPIDQHGGTRDEGGRIAREEQCRVRDFLRPRDALEDVQLRDLMHGLGGAVHLVSHRSVGATGQNGIHADTSGAELRCE